MNNQKIATIGEITGTIQKKLETAAQAKVYRFELFKGAKDDSGKVSRVKTLGYAYLREGLRTYSVTLKTFLKDKFYLLPNNRTESGTAFTILTREDSQQSGRKYFWNNVGDARFMDGPNHGLMQLSWDLLNTDVYMNLHAMNVTELPDTAKEAA